MVRLSDGHSRRISKNETSGLNVTFIYDGWNPVAVYGGSGLSKTYTWGMDLSGSMQGAGGVGGLLAVEEASGGDSYYPTYDGNGNVSEYLDSTGAVVAHYEYDAFGRTTVSNGAKAGDFVHRFSTKQLDAVGLYYYGYRYYQSEVGRWLGRDPIEETGGLNLYGFVNNDGSNQTDFLGLDELDTDEWVEEIAKIIERIQRRSEPNSPINHDVLFQRIISRYFELDKEDDWFWSCKNDVTNIIDAMYKTYSKDNDNAANGHFRGFVTGIEGLPPAIDPTSILTHFYAGAKYGPDAQQIFELISAIGDRDHLDTNDTVTDNFAAYTGSVFITKILMKKGECGCREMLKKFSTGELKFSTILGSGENWRNISIDRKYGNGFENNMKGKQQFYTDLYKRLRAIKFL